MIVSAPGVTRTDLLRQKIEDTLRSWGDTHFQEALDFEKQMKALRASQARSGLPAKSGTQSANALYGEIPASLYSAISRAVGSPHWHHDPSTRDIFWSMFQIGKIRKGAKLPNHE